MKRFKIFKVMGALSLFFTLTLQAQIKIGNNPTTIGANANLEVEATNGNKVSISKDSGRVVIKDGSEGLGKVLTSDADGQATWVTPISGSIGIEDQPGRTGIPGIPGAATPGAPAAGITIVTNGSGTWIYNPTTNVWTNINGQKGDVNGNVNINAVNGLNVAGQSIKLGGNLTEPTTINSSAINTLTIAGLQAGQLTDDLLTMDPSTGVIKKINAVEFSMGTNVAKQKLIAVDGETVFATVWPIDSLDKIQVYRNGAEVDFEATEGTSKITLQLYADTNGGCLAGDEIRIYQWK